VLPLPLSDELRIWQVYLEVFRLVILFVLFAVAFHTVEWHFKSRIIQLASC